jgi:UDP-N-acetylmuramoyl-L-alanyl-D-glutamate--2,6-diaminopimelate ligase
MITRERIEARLSQRGLALSWVGDPPTAFAGLAVDSRAAAPGDLFCAIRGSETDGHHYLDRAAAAGAVAALVERAVGSSSLPQLVVPDTRAAAAHVASLQFSDPGVGVSIAGVTGTNGKTTTTLILRHLMVSVGPAAAVGTLGVVDPAGERRPGRLTTPGPLDLMATVDELRLAGAAFLALEVSSHALAQRRVEALDFDCAVFTNMTRDHLDYHSEMDVYRDTKLGLAGLVSSDGACVVNLDDEIWRDADYRGRRVVGYGRMSTADVRAEDVRLDPAGSRWTLICAGRRHLVRLPLIGSFNVSNALAAAAAALELGADPDALPERLAATPQVPGRMEALARQPMLVLRDYAHTPDALSRALEALRPFASGRLIVVFGCGGDRDRGKRPLMGRIAATGADMAIVTSDNPRSEDPGRIARDIVDGLPSDAYRLVLDRREAIAHALDAAGPHDVVLLAGKGHETYQEVGGRRIPFDESRIVAGLLAGGEA